MTTIRPLPFLRLALLDDAMASGATGLLIAGGAGVLDDLLGLPAPLMRGAGLFLVPYALAVAFVGTRAMVARGAALAIVAVNVLWVIESLVLLAAGWVAPTALGTAFVLFQAVVVGGFAMAQWLGLRRSAGVPAAA